MSYLDEQQRPHFDDAVRALAHRVHERDKQPPEDRADPNAWAIEFMTSLLGHHWRRTVPDKPAPARRTAPPDYSRAQQLRQEAEQIRDRNKQRWEQEHGST
ncbi:hypothetical protein ACIBH1_45410 [Nonomuraea sp. NPDC050663]|uniref:hypothetical protein n=1 Tax=Nonomuraea sp. NPDC050663 TaxID=3364370 RepID=UPI0037AC5E2C